VGVSHAYGPEHRTEDPSEWAAIKSVAAKLGVHHEERTDLGAESSGGRG
jgi:hypothetical protein